MNRDVKNFNLLFDLVDQFQFYGYPVKNMKISLGYQIILENEHVRKKLKLLGVARTALGATLNANIKSNLYTTIEFLVKLRCWIAE